MMRLKETTRAKLMMLHGAAMLILGLGLLYIRTTMTNGLSYFFGCAFALLLVGASLLFITLMDWMCAAGLGARHVSKLRGLLFLSTAAAACSVFLFFYPRGTVHMLGYVIAIYALLLGIGKAYLARFWIGTRREQVAMGALAGVAFVFSVILFGVASHDERDVLAVIAFYSLFIGFQIFLSIFYLRRNLEDIRAAPRSRHVRS